MKWFFNLFKDKIIISFKLFNGVSVKVANWYIFKMKYDAKNILKICGGWMNIKQKRGGAMIISLYFLTY